MKGFMDFIREQGVVGLAVGFILGGAVSGLVSSLVDNIINPLLSWVLGSVDLAERTWVLVDPTLENPEGVVMAWGSVISTFVDFLVIAAVVYFGVKGLKLDKLDKAKK